MGLVVLVLLLALPLAELYVIVQVSLAIGFWNCLGILIVLSLLGAWLLKRQGTTMWRKVQTQLNQREVPTRTVVDGFVGMAAAILLLVPGFITAAVGLFLLIPPVHALASRMLMRRWGGQAVVLRSTYRGPVTDATYRGPVTDTTATVSEEPPTKGELGPS
jgi:UPF0716 protein FxsA